MQQEEGVQTGVEELLEAELQPEAGALEVEEGVVLEAGVSKEERFTSYRMKRKGCAYLLKSAADKQT